MEIDLAAVNATYRRRLILEILARAPGNEAQAGILDTLLSERRLRTPRAELLKELDWLHDQGLVTVERVGPLTVATATQAGLDVAAGEVTVEGIARPERRC